MGSGLSRRKASWYKEAQNSCQIPQDVLAETARPEEMPMAASSSIARNSVSKSNRQLAGQVSRMAVWDIVEPVGKEIDRRQGGRNGNRNQQWC
jgi:hypothetical protein